MEFISGNSEDEVGRLLAKFWENNTGKKLYSPYSAIGYISLSRRLDGVVLFTEYTGSNVEVHFKGYRCLNRAVIRKIGDYVFNDLKCNVLRVKPHSKDEKIIEYIKRLGFEYECTLNKYYDIDDHAVIFKIDREKAKKWISLNGNA